MERKTREDPNFTSLRNGMNVSIGLQIIDIQFKIWMVDH